MIEVTDEMRHIGGEMLRKCRDMEVFHEQAADAAYRAMRALEPKVEQAVKASAYRYPPDGIAPELDTYLVQQADHLDALQALVLVLAARSPGYPPGDATLTRLIAELENAR